MDIGYIREFKGSMSRIEQERILRESGLKLDGAKNLWIDVDTGKRGDTELFPNFARAMESIGDTAARGDRLMIASAAVLGSTRAQVLAALEAIGSRGLSIYDAAIDKSIAWHRSATHILALAVRAETEVRQGITRRARDSKVKLGITGGRPPKITPELRAQAKTLWDDLTISVPTLSTKTGISVSTLYRMFGPKSATQMDPTAPPRGRKQKATVKIEKTDGEIREMARQSRAARGADRSTAAAPKEPKRPTGPAKASASPRKPKPTGSGGAAVRRRRKVAT